MQQLHRLRPICCRTGYLIGSVLLQRTFQTLTEFLISIRNHDFDVVIHSFLSSYFLGFCIRHLFFIAAISTIYHEQGNFSIIFIP